jgi:hypothetical protein
VKGPHNIWRLVRTGATFERTGAMGAVLEAMDAPRPVRVAARVLGWPFKWLGLEGRSVDAAGSARADGARTCLHQVRPDPVDAPRRGGRPTGARIAGAAGQAAAVSQGRRPARCRNRDGKAARRAVLGVFGARRRGLHRAGPQGAAGRNRPRWRSRSCARGGARVSQGHRRLLPDRLGHRDIVAGIPPIAAARRDRAFRRRGHAGAGPADRKLRRRGVRRQHRRTMRVSSFHPWNGSCPGG